MANRTSYGASELERGCELEMDDTEQLGEAGEGDFEFAEDGTERELGPHESLAERLAGLASREYESEAELDERLDEAFENAQEQFLGTAFKKLRNKVIRGAPGLMKRLGGLSGLKGLLPTDLLKKSLIAAAKGVMATNPALAALAPAIGPALKGLGLGEAEYASDEVWQNFETMTESAYEHLVENLTDEAVQPLGAIQLAGKSLQHGMNAARAAGGEMSGGGGRRRRVIKIRGGRPGDEIVIRFV
jgi:hypothetical protein